MWRRLRVPTVFILGITLTSAAAARAFTATPAATSVIRQMRSAATQWTAVYVRRSGALVYCPAVPEGWTYAPQSGCRIPATVTEEYDLADGHIERVIGHVVASRKARFEYVVDSSGWYRTTVGSGCWTLKLRGFVAPLLVDYPLPNEQVAIASRTSTRILLTAFSRRDAYEEVSAVNPKTFFDYRDIEISYAGQNAYLVSDKSRRLHAQAPRPSTTPTCAQP